MSREFSTIGVVGLGTMGAGIAEVFARNGYAVVGVEQNDEQLERGRAHVQHSTDRALKRGKLTEDEQKAIFDRLTLTTSLEDLKDCDLVVEAVVEHLDLKRQIFRQLDDIVRPDAVLATNTNTVAVIHRRMTSPPRLPRRSPTVFARARDWQAASHLKSAGRSPSVRAGVGSSFPWRAPRDRILALSHIKC